MNGISLNFTILRNKMNTFLHETFSRKYEDCTNVIQLPSWLEQKNINGYQMVILDNNFVKCVHICNFNLKSPTFYNIFCSTVYELPKNFMMKRLDI